MSEKQVGELDIAVACLPASAPRVLLDGDCNLRANTDGRDASGFPKGLLPQSRTGMDGLLNRKTSNQFPGPAATHMEARFSSPAIVLLKV